MLRRPRPPTGAHDELVDEGHPVASPAPRGDGAAFGAGRRVPRELAGLAGGEGGRAYRLPPVERVRTAAARAGLRRLSRRARPRAARSEHPLRLGRARPRALLLTQPQQREYAMLTIN